MERRFPRDFQALDLLFRFADEFFADEGVAEAHRFPLRFALEEIFTNLVKYHPGNRHEVAVALERLGGDVRVTLTDFDVDEFDVTRSADPHVEAPLAERKVGGLGLFLTRKLMDAVDYQYANRQSRIVLTKKVD